MELNIIGGLKLWQKEKEVSISLPLLHIVRTRNNALRKTWCSDMRTQLEMIRIA